jgi:hypothetical protein
MVVIKRWVGGVFKASESSRLSVLTNDSQMLPLQADDPCWTHWFWMQSDPPPQHRPPQSCAPAWQHWPLRHCDPGWQMMPLQMVEPSGRHCDPMQVWSAVQQLVPPQHVWPDVQHWSPHWLAMRQQRVLDQQVSSGVQHFWPSPVPHCGVRWSVGSVGGWVGRSNQRWTQPDLPPRKLPTPNPHVSPARSCRRRRATRSSGSPCSSR